MSIIHEPSFGNLYIETNAKSISLHRTEKELTFVLAHLNLAREARVLDVGCNSGRHAISLAQKGFRVTGVDSEPQAIEFARAACDALKVTVTLIVGDMAKVSLQGFDAAICLGTSLGFHETIEGDIEQLRSIQAALIPGGKFILEVTSLFAQQYKEFGTARRIWWKQGETLVIDEGIFDALTCRAHHTTEYFKSKVHRIREEYYRVFAPTEIACMLSLTGFIVERVYGDFSEENFGLNSPSYLAICTKPS